MRRDEAVMAHGTARLDGNISDNREMSTRGQTLENSNENQRLAHDPSC